MAISPAERQIGEMPGWMGARPMPSPSATPLETGARAARIEDAIRRIGAALNARCDEVRAQVIAHGAGGEPVVPFVRDSFERICAISTIAVARWMAGGDPKEVLATGAEAWEIFGELAAQRAAPLHEMTKRCLYWRDAVDAIVHDEAAALDAPHEALAHARAMLQRTFDVTLVKMCEVFESERERTDDELTRRQQELAFIATHDTLTSLPNRGLIRDHGEQMLVRARRAEHPVAALSIDVDNFKSINDSLGRTAGDEILRALAQRFDGVLRGSDGLARVGGDEFVVIADGVSLGVGPELIAERLLDALREPFRVGDVELAVTASIGLATGVRACVDELLRDAETAMYHAKRDGKDRYVVFESGMQNDVQTQLELEMDLRHALAREQLLLVYQPTFDLHELSPNGMEALVRWRHPRRGIVMPGDFVPLLEQTGLVGEVGHWVLREACDQAARWRDAGHAIGVAVNVSARQLDSDDLLAQVRASLQDSGLDASALTLEITETALMRNAEDTAGRLAAIKALGVRIAIDDFGTGYSSLAHLQRFPVDALKIDRSFTSALTANAEGETLMRTLVQLGKALSIETLAEGIEQRRELALLREASCDSGQGYLFAKPLAADEVIGFLDAWDARAIAAITPPPQSRRLSVRP
jgi:diguanylate cyclase (GGDEF)-like protein